MPTVRLVTGSLTWAEQHSSYSPEACWVMRPAAVSIGFGQHRIPMSWVERPQHRTSVLADAM